MNRDKAIHSVMIILPALIALGMFLAPAKFPVYVHEAGLVVLVAIAVANRLATPPWVKAALVGLQQALTQAGAPAGTFSKTIMAAKRGKIASIATSIIALVMLPLALLSSACGASQAQLDKTFNDGKSAAVCVLAKILTGITDPIALLGCADVTYQFIVDVVNDFQSKPAAMQAAVAGHPLTAEQQKWLDDAKINAVTAMAQKVQAK